MPLVYMQEVFRKPDTQYEDLLRMVLTQGVQTDSAHQEKSLTIMNPLAMKFNLRNGVPLVTTRDMSRIWPSAVGELLAFINGVHTLEGLREFGVSDRFWDRWVTEKKCKKRGLPAGDLGPGSYGPAFHDFPTADGPPFNQIQHMVEQIHELPELRSHRVVNWIPQYQVRGEGKQQRVVVTPCHGDMFFRVIDGKLTLTMIQHKADLMVGVPNNMIQYAAFLLAMGHVTGMEVSTYWHVLVDAHLYELGEDDNDGSVISQIDAANMIVTRKPRVLPKLELTDDAPSNIFEFRTRHFKLSEYNPHPAIKGIGTAI